MARETVCRASVRSIPSLLRFARRRQKVQDGAKAKPCNLRHTLNRAICFACITQTEQELDHVFKLVNKEKGVYRCVYCEKKVIL
ncbi:MAG: hypothetical protein IJX06_02530 [Clostridia bacterium]|nr:hypothetical protein [Clostridia bacterium]